MNYDSVDVGKMEKAIRSPQENVAAKDYQNWLEFHWWGVKQLKLLSQSVARRIRNQTKLYIWCM